MDEAEALKTLCDLLKRIAKSPERPVELKEKGNYHDCYNIISGRLLS